MALQMTDLAIRIEGRAGRITLTRPEALNALTHDMCLAIEDTLDTWRADPAISLVVIDAQGDRAFCAGGDIVALHRTGASGDHDYGRRFWSDEYRMNAKLAEFPKPIVSLMQGFIMGGGVGLGCHVLHRVVCETSQFSMPECGIGFVPDVGGSFLLSRAPGRLGEYCGLTAERIGPGDAIRAGFADCFVSRELWPTLIEELCKSGKVSVLSQRAGLPPPAVLAGHQTVIDRLFAGANMAEVMDEIHQSETKFAVGGLKRMMRNSPLSMALTLEMLRRLRAPGSTLRQALELEYRVAHRATTSGDFIEGIRAAVIDKDRNPRWKHRLDAVPADAVTDMLKPLGAEALTFEKD